MISGVAGVGGESMMTSPPLALAATTSSSRFAAVVSAVEISEAVEGLGSLTILGPFSRTRPTPELMHDDEQGIKV